MKMFFLGNTHVEVSDIWNCLHSVKYSEQYRLKTLDRFIPSCEFCRSSMGKEFLCRWCTSPHSTDVYVTVLVVWCHVSTLCIDLTIMELIIITVCASCRISMLYSTRVIKCVLVMEFFHVQLELNNCCLMIRLQVEQAITFIFSVILI